MINVLAFEVHYMNRGYVEMVANPYNESYVD